MADKQQTKPQQQQGPKQGQQGNKPRNPQQGGGQAKRPAQNGSSKASPKPTQAVATPKPQGPALSADEQSAVTSVRQQLKAAGVDVTFDAALTACKGTHWNVQLATEKLKGAPSFSLCRKCEIDFRLRVAFRTPMLLAFN